MSTAPLFHKLNLVTIFTSMSELSQLEGVGPKRVSKLQSAGIERLRDLIYYVPRRYLDRSVLTPVSQLREGVDATFCATVTCVDYASRSGKDRLTVTVSDDTGSIDLVYFNGVRFWKDRYKEGQYLQASGVPSYFRSLQLVHPDTAVLRAGERPVLKILPIYALTQGLHSSRIEHKFIQKIALQALEKYSFTDPLPESVRELFGLAPEMQLLKGLHQPVNIKDIPSWRRQIQLRELLPLCMRQEVRRKLGPEKDRVEGGGQKLRDKWVSELPFSLTDGQCQCLLELQEHLAKGEVFNGLLQGDVGSGKTVVALLSGARAFEAGYQAAFMAPTEILARQQYEGLKVFLEASGLKAAYLTGSTTGEERKGILQGLSSGEIKLVVGTHALYSDDVKYAHLDYLVIDEQHRFGVNQREALINKGKYADVLYLSATPIPRTLTQTVYGDMECVRLTGKPPGRKEVKTQLVPWEKRCDMLKYLLKEVQSNAQQVFWVVPRITGGESDNEDIIPDEGEIEEQVLKSMTVLEKELKSYSGQWRVSCIHGQMHSDAKQEALAAFRDKQIDVLVATTIIEVGVDIPDANIMIVENPDRFGMAQLHQLRGRVGRSSQQAWCFLTLPQKRYPAETEDRLREFCRTEDGFVIAEMDLQNRGGGNIEGLEQSGFGHLKYTDILRDKDLILEVRAACGNILEGKTTVTRQEAEQVGKL